MKIFIISLCQKNNKFVEQILVSVGYSLSNNVKKSKTKNNVFFSGSPIFCPNIFLNYTTKDNKFIYVNSEPSEWYDEIKKSKISEKGLKLFIGDNETENDFHELFLDHQQQVMKYIPQNNVLYINVGDDPKNVLDFLNYRKN